MRFHPRLAMAAATAAMSRPLTMATRQSLSARAWMAYRGSVNRMDSPGVTSRFPLLPVKPVRYLRLGLKAARKASRLRSARLEATARRRSWNSLRAAVCATTCRLANREPGPGRSSRIDVDYSQCTGRPSLGFVQNLDSRNGGIVHDRLKGEIQLSLRAWLQVAESRSEE